MKPILRTSCLIPRLSALLLLSSLLLAGCAGPQRMVHRSAAPGPEMQPVRLEKDILPEWLRPPTNLFTLGPGDRIEITILSDPTTRATTTVGPDGKIYYYLLPGLDVWGQTLGGAKAAIEAEVGKLIRDEPRVSLTLRGVASQRVWLLGRLVSPGVYTLTNQLTLLEAIATAGGPGHARAEGAPSTGPSAAAGEDAVDWAHAFVMRQGELLPVDFQRLVGQGDLSQNIYLQPDDFVYFPSAQARDICVLGAVHLPQKIGFVESTSLVQAIAQAGGTVKGAHLTEVAVVRGSLTQPRIGLVNCQAIVRGHAPDFLLEPGDIVYVPFNPYRTLGRYADTIANTFVRTIGVNEGARAISPAVIPVGANVPIGP